jgi:hypothetical protein
MLEELLEKIAAKVDVGELLSKISPKAIVAFALPLVASLALYLITGDDTYLVGVLLAIATGGSAAVVPPAPKVRQREVAATARARRRRR